MKKNIFKTTVLGLFAAVLIVVPTCARAADSTNAPAAEASTKHKRNDHTTLPFIGKLSAIDTNAMTLTVGERTFEITSETKIAKDGFPATLADGVVGEATSGAYRKNASGKLSATSIHFRSQSDGTTKKKKKPAVESSGTSTNSVVK